MYLYRFETFYYDKELQCFVRKYNDEYFAVQSEIILLKKIDHDIIYILDYT
jgi:hypothetical protein